jgi:hypothetical protein
MLKRASLSSGEKENDIERLEKTTAIEGDLTFETFLSNITLADYNRFSAF